MSLHVRAVSGQSQPPATPADNSFRQRSSESGKKSTSLAARVQRLAALQEVTKQLYEVESAINMTKHQMVKRVMRIPVVEDDWLTPDSGKSS